MVGVLPLFAYRMGGSVDWLVHTVISAVIHGLLFSFVLRVMRELSLPQAALLVIVVLVVLFAWGAGRDRRRW